MHVRSDLTWLYVLICDRLILTYWQSWPMLKHHHKNSRQQYKLTCNVSTSPSHSLDWIICQIPSDTDHTDAYVCVSTSPLLLTCVDCLVLVERTSSWACLLALGALVADREARSFLSESASSGNTLLSMSFPVPCYSSSLTPLLVCLFNESSTRTALH